MVETLLGARKPVIAMIHVGALPGTPANRASVRETRSGESIAVLPSATKRGTG